MLVESIARTESGCFSSQQIQVAERQTELLPFLNKPFSIDQFQAQIAEKKSQFTPAQRLLLVEGLTLQYLAVDAHEKVSFSISELLNENTFTVTTGHQMALFTGPLYFIYKILHVIKACVELKRVYPLNNFIPVYWMVSEDHDFEEIRAIAIFNQLIDWDTNQMGAVGRFDTDGLEEITEKIKSFFSNHPEANIFEVLNAHKGETYGIAFFRLIHTLFADYGLVVLDGDNVVFKTAFLPIVKKEIIEGFSFHAVESSSKALEKAGLKTQVNPRAINLFLLSPNKRERIIKNEFGFLIGDRSFSQDELLQMLNESPQDFSPNVILRPLYQEFILPNLCYVGGPGELNYWLQLKGVFDEVQLVFPLIQARSSLFYVSHSMAQKISGLGLTPRDFFMEKQAITQLFLVNNNTSAIDFSDADKQFKGLNEILVSTSVKGDANLSRSVGADLFKIDAMYNSIKSKIWRAEKVKHETAIKLLEQIKEQLFPNGKMQERAVNFLQLCADGDVKGKLQTLYKALDPFDNAVKIVIDDDNDTK